MSTRQAGHVLKQAVPPARLTAVTGHPADGIPSWAAKALEDVLTATYWFDPPEHGGLDQATMLIARLFQRVARLPGR